MPAEPQEVRTIALNCNVQFPNDKKQVPINRGENCDIRFLLVTGDFIVPIDDSIDSVILEAIPFVNGKVPDYDMPRSIRKVMSKSDLAQVSSKESFYNGSEQTGIFVLTSENTTIQEGFHALAITIIRVSPERNAPAYIGVINVSHNPAAGPDSPLIDVYPDINVSEFIALLGETREAAAEAKVSKESAASSAGVATQSKDTAVQAKTDAVSAKNAAQQSASDANESQASASTSASEANGFANDANVSAQAAEQSHLSSESFAQQSEVSAQNAKLSEDSAKQSEESASASAGDAQTSKDAAALSAGESAQSAIEAQSQAENSRLSAEASEGSAQSAGDSAERAETAAQALESFDLQKATENGNKTDRTIEAAPATKNEEMPTYGQVGGVNHLLIVESDYQARKSAGTLPNNTIFYRF